MNVSVRNFISRSSDFSFSRRLDVQTKSTPRTRQQLLQTAMMTTSAPAEGKRATALRTVLNRSLEKTIQTCSYSFVVVNLRNRYDKVAQSLPTLATRTPDQLRYALDQSLNFLKTQILVLVMSFLR